MLKVWDKITGSHKMCGYSNVIYVKGGVNPIFFFKHIECCNFQTITVMYIKVYISGMKMSQRINF